MPLFGVADAAPNKDTPISYWFSSLSTVLSPTENSRIQGVFNAFAWFSSTFQSSFYFFKKALKIQVLIKLVQNPLISFVNIKIRKYKLRQFSSSEQGTVPIVLVNFFSIMSSTNSIQLRKTKFSQEWITMATQGYKTFYKLNSNEHKLIKLIMLKCQLWLAF